MLRQTFSDPLISSYSNTFDILLYYKSPLHGIKWAKEKSKRIVYLLTSSMILSKLVESLCENKD